MNVLLFAAGLAGLLVSLHLLYWRGWYCCPHRALARDALGEMMRHGLRHSWWHDVYVGMRSCWAERGASDPYHSADPEAAYDATWEAAREERSRRTI